MFSSNLRGRHSSRHLRLLMIFFIAAVAIKAEHLPVKLYTTADGLWSSAINYVMRDSRGFIWFCTRDGISRFDGYGFTNYKINDDPVAAYVSYMFEDSRGVFWIALDGGGFYRFDPGHENASGGSRQTGTTSDDGRLVIHAELVGGDKANTFYEDAHGNLWLGANGLFLIKDRSGRVEHESISLNLPEALKPNFMVYAITESLDGSLWLGTSNGLLRKMPDGRIQRYSGPPRSWSDTIKQLIVDHDQRVWIGSQAGLYVLKPEPIESLATSSAFRSVPLNPRKPNPSARRILPENPGETLDLTDAASATTAPQVGQDARVVGLNLAPNGRVYVGIGFVLAVFDGEYFQPYTSVHGLVDVQIGPFAEDSDGDLWAASISGPLKVSVGGIKSFDRADGLGNAAIESIVEEPGGAVDAVGTNWSINRFDDRRFKAVRPNIPADAVHSWTSSVAFVDHTGDWWFLVNRQGLYRFAHINRIEELASRKPTALYTERNGLKSNNLYCMFEDSRGDLWISTRGLPADSLSTDGLTRWDRATETFHTFTEQDGLPNAKAASSFAEDKSGNLWFGFYQGGVARYAAGHFTVFSVADGPNTALLVDRSGRLWIASAASGLFRVEDPNAANPQFINYSTNEGLSTKAVRCLTEDTSGRIYVGTVRGVDRLVPETGKFTHYTVADGLAADFVRSAFRDRQGELWFGTFNGLSRLDPQPDRAVTAPSISISGLRVSGVSQTLSAFGSSVVSGLEFAPSQNDLQIDFFSLSIAHAASLRYQYKLEGSDDDWSPLSEQRTVNYANVPPGAYRLLVRAVNADGIVSTTPASVSFRILPPIWRRWWFITIASIIVGLTIYAGYRYRFAHLLELERVRTRIAADLHDDIGASLSRVAIMSEVLKQQSRDGNGQATRILTDIAESARESVDSMSDIVWAIDPRRDTLNDVVLRIRQFASEVLEARGIKWEFEVSPEADKIKLDAEHRRHLLLIFKEAINNIVRHAECRSVRLSISVAGSQLKAEIRDDGKGFDDPSPPVETDGRGGHGLNNIRARTTELHGRRQIVTAPGAGTNLIVEFPIK